MAGGGLAFSIGTMPIWTEMVAQRVDALAGLVSSDQNIKRAEIWTDGKLSDRTKAELGQRSIGYQSLAR